MIDNGNMFWSKATLLLLLAVFLIVGCGGSRAAMSRTRRSTQVGLIADIPSANKSGSSQTILAEGALPEDGRFVIFVMPSKPGGELYYYSEGPGRRRGKGTGRHLWGAGGGVITLGRRPHSSLRVLELNVGGGCGSSHRYALAFGLLRDTKDAVTDRAHGRRLRFMETHIPGRFDAEGVLVYSLLMTGRNHVVAQAPNGRIVDSKWYFGGCGRQ